ncbi:MAG: sodium:proton antiporter [Rikenellaceae bacterium]
MEEMELLAPLAFVIVSLIAGALLKLVLTRVKLPYTVGLFVLGMVVGVLNMNGWLEATPVISSSISMVCNLDPDMILNIFLPILIFSAAYELDVHIFKKTLVNSTLLAVPGLIIAMLLTAAVMMGISIVAPAYAEWNWTFALMFGALISATDPVAVVALLGELGVSKRFSTLIDGESMLNDGTGIVLFMLMFAPFTSSVEAADPSPVISFLVVVFGGLVIGYLMARAFLFYATRRSVRGDALLQTSVMILLSYITFILAQDIFKLSGVIALVMFGLVVAYSGYSRLDERAQRFMKEFWGLLSYIANTLIFIIMGIIIAEKVDFAWRDLAVLLAVYVGINVVRIVMIGLLYPIMRRNGYGINRRESMILTWGALRGALALTLALMVSYTESIPEPVRRQVLLLTAGIVTMTLVINATTIKWLLKKLGLLEQSASRQLIAAEVRSKLQSRGREYIERLRNSGEFEGVDWAKVEPLLPKYEQERAAAESLNVLAGLRMQIISAERQVMTQMFTRGEIEIAAQRKLIGALDALVDQDGLMALDDRLSGLGLNGSSLEVVRRNKWLRFISLHYMLTTPIERYQMAYGVLKAQSSALEVLHNATSVDSATAEHIDSAMVEQLESEIKNIMSAAKEYITKFKEEHSQPYSQALTERAQRVVRHHNRETIEALVTEGVIDEEEATELHKFQNL